MDLDFDIPALDLAGKKPWNKSSSSVREGQRELAMALCRRAHEVGAGIGNAQNGST